MARILLAEDEFLIRLILVEELTDHGYEVIATGNGDEAAALANDGQLFDLVLTDIQMPGRLDGVGLAQRVRERQPEVPVIYVTGRPEVLGKVGQPGPHDVFVRKPYSAREVVSIVQKLLER
jgi:CheY-like chemotaxis protein